VPYILSVRVHVTGLKPAKNHFRKVLTESTVGKPRILSGLAAGVQKGLFIGLGEIGPQAG
jgi:hypothetical protein